jgi:hypothetical protein
MKTALLKRSRFAILSALLATLVLGVSPIFAATYYMATTGASSNSGTSQSPWATLTDSFQHMSSGDTLIIKDGTYTGDRNMIGIYDTAVEPPKGTSSAYTTIKAEHDGGVIFDGQSSRCMFYLVNSGARYFKFEGIIWQNMNGSTVYLQDASYIKFIKCGAGDSASGNNMNFCCGRNTSYILFENCYSWGTGRYKFATYHSDHVIFRQCVGRPDGINAGGEPAAIFVAYASTYVKFQNCIAIDADQTAYWSNIGDRQGSFYVPCTDGQSNYIDYDQSIGLNVKLGGIQSSKNTDSANVKFTNIVIWDSDDSGTTLNMVRGSSNTVKNCTFGNGTESSDIWYWDGANGTLKNTIMYHMVFSGAMFAAAPNTQDYNCYYANSKTSGRSGSHDLTSYDPTTGSLKYLPRIEQGSTLKGAGESSADIGANVLTLIGTSGALWGETGYATDTGVSMWPFPNEALIKTKLAAYNKGGVSGARGFCASGKQLNGTDAITLTSYIWEYMGNAMPSTIYGSVTTVPGQPTWQN